MAMQSMESVRDRTGGRRSAESVVMAIARFLRVAFTSVLLSVGFFVVLLFGVLGFELGKVLGFLSQLNSSFFGLEESGQHKVVIVFYVFFGACALFLTIAHYVNRVGENHE